MRGWHYMHWNFSVSWWLLLLAVVTVSDGQPACRNTVSRTVYPDEGCSISLPVCVLVNGIAPGFNVTGHHCARCVRTTTGSTASSSSSSTSSSTSNSSSQHQQHFIDEGCSSRWPRCVLDDGVTVPRYNVKGTKCVGSDGAPPPLVVVGDWRIRFNKFSFLSSSSTMANLLPLPINDTHYPVQGIVADILQTQTNAVSVMTPADPELHGAQAHAYIDLVGGYPSHPNANPDHPFWDLLRHVVTVQLLRRNSTPLDLIMPVPDFLQGMDIHEAAEIVHDEYPGAVQARFIERLWREQAIRLDYTIIPFRSAADFVGLQVRFADLNTWAIRTVSCINFLLKWTTGRARPEEIAWMIAQGNLTTEQHGVPPDIVEMVGELQLQSATDFTAYPEGSPRHPSWPAMHSAASSASLWLAIVADLTPEQKCQARLVDWVVSYARTIAGVHYTDDNIAGYVSCNSCPWGLHQ